MRFLSFFAAIPPDGFHDFVEVSDSRFVLGTGTLKTCPTLIDDTLIECARNDVGESKIDSPTL